MKYPPITNIPSLLANLIKLSSRNWTNHRCPYDLISAHMASYANKSHRVPRSATQNISRQCRIISLLVGKKRGKDRFHPFFRLICNNKRLNNNLRPINKLLVFNNLLKLVSSNLCKADSNNLCKLVFNNPINNQFKADSKIPINNRCKMDSQAPINSPINNLISKESS